MKMNRFFVLPFLLFAPTFLYAGEPAKIDLTNELWTAQAEQLVAFSVNIDSKVGSWENEIRDQALALARKMNPAVKSIAEAAKAPRANMSADEKAADKAARENLAKSDKERTAAEAALDAKSPGSPPAVKNIRDELELARYEMARENLDFARDISANPAGRDFASRAKFLTRAAELMATPKWHYEKKLKEQIEAVKRAPYAPWNGKWKTEWGTLALTQSGANVTGTGENTRVQGAFDGKVLKGSWQNQNVGGTLEWQIAPDDKSFQGSNKEVPSKAPAAAFSGTRVEGGAE